MNNNKIIFACDSYQNCKKLDLTRFRPVLIKTSKILKILKVIKAIHTHVPIQYYFNL